MDKKDYYTVDDGSVIGPFDGFYYESEDVWVVPELGMIAHPNSPLWSTPFEAEAAALETPHSPHDRSRSDGRRFSFGKPLRSPDMDVMLILLEIARNQRITKTELRGIVHRFLPQMIDPSVTKADIHLWVALALGYRSWAHLRVAHGPCGSTYTGLLYPEESHSMSLHKLMSWMPSA